MEKILIGVGALAVGLAVGMLAIGPMFSDDEPGGAGGGSGAVATIGTGVSKEELAEASRLREEAEKKAEQFKRERDRLIEQATERRAGEKAAEEANLKIRRERDAFERELAEERQKSKALEEEVKGLPDKLAVEARIAEARKKGRVIADDIAAMMEKGEGKDALLKSLRELIKLGTDAMPEYWEAFLLISAKGDAFGGNNDLGLNWMESASLMPSSYADFTLGPGAKDAPTNAYIWAMYGTAYNMGKAPEDKIKTLGEILANGDKQFAIHAVNAMNAAMTPLAAPHLAQAATNGGYDPDVRAAAILGMAAYESAADWNSIEQLRNDSDPKVAEAARSATNVRDSTANPPATGYLATSISTEGSAYRAGMRVGDIITRYNGQAVTDQATLVAARNAAGEDLQVVVVIQRGAQSLTLTLPTGPLGVSAGKAVVKP